MPPLSSFSAKDLLPQSPLNHSPSISPRRCNHQRKVVFSSSLEAVVQTISVAEYSVDELAATWYRADDMKSFKRDRRETVERMEQGKSFDCLRGVEHWTKEGARIRFVNVRLGIDSVLDEQDLQDLDGKENPEMLAHICRMHTSRSQEEAYERGFKDQREIRAGPQLCY